MGEYGVFLYVRRTSRDMAALFIVLATVAIGLVSCEAEADTPVYGYTIAPTPYGPPPAANVYHQQPVAAFVQHATPVAHHAPAAPVYHQPTSVYHLPQCITNLPQFTTNLLLFTISQPLPTMNPNLTI